jgi:DNA-binding Xre family transcriptional regulator
VRWNLRWVAAQRDIWRPSDLLEAFKQVGFTPSLSKVAALWGQKPITVRLDDLDKICAALGCTVADLLEAEPQDHQAGKGQDAAERQAVGGQPVRGGERGSARPIPRRGTGSGPGAARRSLPPN